MSRRRSKRKSGETDTSVISFDDETGEIITTQIKNGKRKVIRIVDEKGVEIMPSHSFGLAVDIHRDFGQISLLVRNNGRVLEFRTAFHTDTASILAAKEWCISIIENNSDPKVKVEEDSFRYSIESTGNYMTPIIILWGGKPTIINPNIAKAGTRKSDIYDSKIMSINALTGTWPESYIISAEVQSLRVLIAERDNCNKLATRCANRIVNILLKFGYTVARNGSVVKKKDVRSFVEDQISEIPEIKPLSDKICVPEESKAVLRELYSDYDSYKARAVDYENQVLNKIYSMEWDTERGKVSGKCMMEVLTSAPGIGPLTAAIWLAYVVTPLRFTSVSSCTAYCGFDPSNKVSAGKVTSAAKRKGQKQVHTSLCQSSHTLIRHHSEPFGQWGFQMKCQGSEKKAKSALGRRLCAALYYMHLRNELFSYELYTIAKEPDVIDISIEELCELNPDFKRYMKALISNGITTTKEMSHSFYVGELNNVHGLGKKAYSLIKEFNGNQKRYRKLLENRKRNMKNGQTNKTGK